MNQLIEVPTRGLAIALAADDVIFLLKLASEARTTRAHWQRLEALDKEVAAAITKAAQQPPSAEAENPL